MTPRSFDDLDELYHHAKFGADPVIYPDPPGGYNPQFSCDTPNHLKFKGGYQGVFMGCLCDRDGRGVTDV